MTDNQAQKCFLKEAEMQVAGSINSIIIRL